MNQIARKTYLGIAIDEVIEEMGLQRSAKKIFQTFEQVFNFHYTSFKNAHHQSSKADGNLYQHFEYPIGGQKDTLQYYLAYGQMNLTITSLRNLQYLRNSNNSILEGFSTNEGAKGKPAKRTKRNNFKGQQNKGKKRTKT